jgi:hypothetical protein
MSKHTPGPWEIEEHYHFGYRWISGPEHSQLAQVVWCMEDEDRSPECEANARLIAAAPELLDVLELALRAHGTMLLSDPPQDPWVSWAVEQKARAAIAKAKGSQSYP